MKLSPNALFAKNDICQEEFRNLFQGRASVVTSVCAFHEFKNPVMAVQNLFQTLTPGGVAFIVDRTEMGWALEGKIAYKESPEAYRHYLDDIDRLTRNTLQTDSDMATFWIRKIFPEFPGEGFFNHHGGAYSVVYRSIA